jgi:hypothetical protein
MHVVEGETPAPQTQATYFKTRHITFLMPNPAFVTVFDWFCQHHPPNMLI